MNLILNVLYCTASPTTPVEFAQEINTAKVVVVSGAGADAVNGTYEFLTTTGTSGECHHQYKSGEKRPVFKCRKTGFDIWYSASYKHWCIGMIELHTMLTDIWYYTTDDGQLPQDWKVSPTDWIETNPAALGTTAPRIAVSHGRPSE